MRLNECSIDVISSRPLMNSAIVPTPVSVDAPSMNSRNLPSISAPEVGTKCANTQSMTASLKRPNSWKDANTLSATVNSGTIANTVVNDSAPAASKHWSSLKRLAMNREKASKCCSCRAIAGGRGILRIRGGVR